MNDEVSPHPPMAVVSPPEIEDADLLRRYVDEGEEEAFAELVRRRIGLVYAVALRQTRGNRHRAEDATQAVFTDLARKAAALSRRDVLVGWLFRSAQFAAAGLVRAEQRRHAREQEANAMEQIHLSDAPPPDWEKLRPILDETLSDISERDRDAIVLRFFDRRSFFEIGQRLRLTENAARMRVQRALQKLQVALARRGIRSTSAALGIALGQQTITAVPVGVVEGVTEAALAHSAGSTGGLLTSLFSMNKLQMCIVGAVAIAGASGFLLQARSHAALRRELVTLHTMQQTVALLRAENRALADAAIEIDALRADEAELGRLRERMASAHPVSRNSDRAAPAPSSERRSTTVTLKFPDAELTTALTVYETIAGTKVIRDSSLAGAGGNFKIVTPEPVSREQALEAISKVLREQAGVIFETNPDGSLTAKRLSSGTR